MELGLSRRVLLKGSGAALAMMAGAPQLTRAQTGQRAGGMIRMIANENPYGPAESALEAMNQALPDSWQYAFRRTGTLKKLIAEREEVSVKHVMIGAGSAEILRVAAIRYGRSGSEVVAAKPTFNILPTYAKNIGAQIVEIPLDGDKRHDLAAMEAAVSPDTGLVYVCNPNNPTGTLLEGSEVRDFVAAVSPRAVVFVDEAYLDLWDDLPEHTAVDRVRSGDRVIVSRTFSKLHGLAGMRIGYGIAPPDIVDELEQFRMSILNLPGLLAAAASYQDLEFQSWSRARIKECLAMAYATFDELGLEYVPSRGNFVLFNTGGSVRDFAAAMRRRGILTGISYAPYTEWARVSMGTVENMEQFSAAARHYFTA